MCAPRPGLGLLLSFSENEIAPVNLNSRLVFVLFVVQKFSIRVWSHSPPLRDSASSYFPAPCSLTHVVARVLCSRVYACVCACVHDVCMYETPLCYKFLHKAEHIDSHPLPQTLAARSSHTLCFTQLIPALLRELISRALIPVRPPLAGCVSRLWMRRCGPRRPRRLIELESEM